MGIDSRALRNAFGRFLTGVTIITTARSGEEPSGLTANSFSSVSLDPPLLLWNLARGADCFAQFQNCDYFAVNILSRDQEELSTLFATKNADKWANTPYHEGRHGCPLLDGSLASFECRVQARHDGGDHVIYLGEVLAFDSPETDKLPLAFFQGKYANLT